MMPLRYVPVPPVLLDCPEKLGNRMPLERAMAVMMLDPSTRYMPIDIARLGFQYAWSLDKDEINSRVANARRSYAEIARLGLNRTNPNLTGMELDGPVEGKSPCRGRQDGRIALVDVGPTRRAVHYRG